MSGSTAGQAGAERERVALAVQGLLDDLVADDPVLGTTLGLTEGAGRLPSWSAGGARAARGAPPRARARAQALARGGGHRRRRRRVRGAAGGAAPAARPGAVGARRSGTPRPCSRWWPASSRCSCASSARVDDRVAAVAGRLEAVPGLLAEAREALEPGLSAAAVESGVDFAGGLLDLVGDTARAFVASVGPRGRGRRAVRRGRRGARGVRRVPAPGARPAGHRRVRRRRGRARRRAPLGALPGRAARGARRLRPRGAGRDPRAHGGARGRGRLRRRGRRRRGRTGGHADGRRPRPRVRARRGRGARRTSSRTTSPACRPARSSR